MRALSCYALYNLLLSFGLSAGLSVGFLMELHAEELDFSRISPAPTSVDRTSYISPNELRPNMFESGLKGKTGALISVGTFRGFYDAAIGNFSYAILFDSNFGVTQFNLAFIDLIRRSPDRIQFIENLFGVPGIGKLLQQYEISGSAASLSEIQIKLLQTQTTTPEWITKFYQSLEKQSPSSQTKFEVEIYKFLKQIKEFYLGGRKLKHSFLSDQDAFTKLKSLADKGHIYVVSGDLAQGENLDQVSKILTREHIQVSVLDISNAQDYFDTEQKAKFQKNLANIPWSEDAKILSTKMSNTTANHYDLWEYQINDAKKISGAQHKSKKSLFFQCLINSIQFREK